MVFHRLVGSRKGVGNWREALRKKRKGAGKWRIGVCRWRKWFVGGGKRFEDGRKGFLNVGKGSFSGGNS